MEKASRIVETIWVSRREIYLVFKLSLIQMSKVRQGRGFVSCSLAAAGSRIVHNVLLKIILARTLLNFEKNYVEKLEIFLAIRKIVSCWRKLWSHLQLAPAWPRLLELTAWPLSQSRDRLLTNQRRDLKPHTNQGPESCQEVGPRKKPEMWTRVNICLVKQQYKVIVKF